MTAKLKNQNRSSSVTFDELLKRAEQALKVIGTGKLRDRPIIREGARAYSPTEAEMQRILKGKK